MISRKLSSVMVPSSVVSNSSGGAGAGGGEAAARGARARSLAPSLARRTNHRLQLVVGDGLAQLPRDAAQVLERDLPRAVLVKERKGAPELVLGVAREVLCGANGEEGLLVDAYLGRAAARLARAAAAAAAAARVLSDERAHLGLLHVKAERAQRDL